MACHCPAGPRVRAAPSCRSTPAHTSTSSRPPRLAALTPSGRLSPSSGSAQGAPPIARRKPDTKDRLSWKWVRGSATTKADFGNPLGGDRLQHLYLRRYAGRLRVERERRLQAARATPNNSRPCWRAKRTASSYRDKDLTPNGLQQGRAQGGRGGRGEDPREGEGVARSSCRRLPITSLPIIAQLNNSDGVCWQATYSSTIRNDVRPAEGKVGLDGISARATRESVPWSACAARRTGGSRSAPFSLTARAARRYKRTVSPP